VPGVEVLDHGQRQLDGARWQVSAQVSGAAALEGLRAVGIEVQRFERGGP
jgi:hypothetical protein